MEATIKRENWTWKKTGKSKKEFYELGSTKHLKTKGISSKKKLKDSRTWRRNQRSSSATRVEKAGVINSSKVNQ